MGKCTDLTGQKFGKLTVIERVENYIDPKGRQRSRWLCKCECGDIIVVVGSSLKRGATTSCGCARKNAIEKRTYQNLIGQRFGRLTVLKEYGRKNLGRTWLCQCDCGNECVVSQRSLKNGNTKSCGCLHNELLSKNSLINLTGKTFGQLTVIERAEDYISPLNYHSVQYLCQCECGNIVKVLSNSLIRNKTISCGCIKSIGEYKINKYLSFNNIVYNSQMKFDSLVGVGGKSLTYDFYLPNNNLLIECQGKQHEKPIEIFGGEEQFKIQQEHDRRKREYAEKNGYRLLEIWYYDYDKIEEILSRELELD